LGFSPLSSHPDELRNAIARPHQGAAIDTTTAAGKLVFGIFAALAAFERKLIPSAQEPALHTPARGRISGASRR
jgi:DNA invertase Pin-like site-specific DNA recombinase